MEQMELRVLLERVAAGQVSTEQAMLQLKEAPFKDIGFAKIDTHRGIRQGIAEVIYGAGKEKEQIFEIVKHMREQSDTAILITRMSKEAANFVMERQQ